MATPKRETEPAAPQIVLKFKEREVVLPCPGDYAPHTVTVWTNPPDSLIAGATSDGALMLHVVRKWTFVAANDQPAPITLETLGTLPGDLFRWLVSEWITCNRRPLVAPLSAERQNGTPASEASPGPTLRLP